MEESLEWLNHNAAALSILAGIVGFMLKVYFVDIKGQKTEQEAIRERLSNVEESLDQNYQNDTASKEEVLKRLSGFDKKMETFSNKLDTFGKAIKAVLKKLEIPDLL